MEERARDFSVRGQSLKGMGGGVLEPITESAIIKAMNSTGRGFYSHRFFP